jgi:hypothetical protein
MVVEGTWGTECEQLRKLQGTQGGPNLAKVGNLCSAYTPQH